MHGDVVDFDDDGWVSTGTQTDGSNEHGLTISIQNGNARVLVQDGVFADLTDPVTGTLPPSFSSGTAVSVDENTDPFDVIYTADATDPDGTDITYTLSGEDAADFNIDAMTGELTFVATPDWEMPADDDTDNIYNIQVTATDEDGEAVTRDVAITVDDVDENPVFSTGNTASLDENTRDTDLIPAADAYSGSLSALTISGGDDADLFELDPATLRLKFKDSVDAPDHENPADMGGTDGDNVYEVELTALDASGRTTTQTVQVTVNDVDDEGPEFTSDATVSMDENLIATGYTPMATADLGGAVTYTISDGADQTLFEFDSNGQLVFINAPDFENPTDVAGAAAKDNVYEVEITATDDSSGLSATQTVAVTVQDVDDTGITILGDSAYDYTGRSVSDAGDVNGDGIADIIIGAQNADPSGRSGAGKAYVIYGGRDLDTIDLSTLTAAQGFAIDGASSGDRLGNSVSSAGDLNGDGYDDLIVGAPYADPQSRNSAGEAYVIYGGQGLGDIDLANELISEQGFRLDGAYASDQAGNSVSNAGDVNGDGYDDLIIGARYADAANTDEGAAYVIYGGPGLTDVDLADPLAISDGFAILGASAGGLAGHSVSSARDVNGDGYDDVIVGAYREAGMLAAPMSSLAGQVLQPLIWLMLIHRQASDSRSKAKIQMTFQASLCLRRAMSMATAMTI